MIDVAISYKEDPDRVIAIMRQVADGMMADSVLSGLILEPMEMFGVDNFTETAVIIKARFKTQAAQQYLVGREYRRRLKSALDAEGVELPPAAQRPVTPRGTGPNRADVLKQGAHSRFLQPNACFLPPFSFVAKHVN